MSGIVKASCARFLLSFRLTAAVLVLSFVGVLHGSKWTWSPLPPLTATQCIDEKLRYSARRDLAGVDFLAVGPSII